MGARALVNQGGMPRLVNLRGRLRKKRSARGAFHILGCGTPCLAAHCPSEQVATLRRRRGRVYRYPEANKPMAANNKSIGGRSAGSAVVRELDQLRKKVKELTLRLEREAKARKLDAQLAAVAKKAREQLTREIKALREQALQDARAKVEELKVELGRKTEHLRRKSGELKKFAEESAHRAAAIIRGDAEHATEPVEAEPATPPAPSELGSKNHPSDKPTSDG